MSVTILGQHIRLIRPERIKVPIPEKFKPGTGVNKRSKTIAKGRVVAICIRLKNGGIRSLCKGLHGDIINTFDIDPMNIQAAGWELEDGNYVWK